jgi:hypothetical protein
MFRVPTLRARRPPGRLARFELLVSSCSFCLASSKSEAWSSLPWSSLMASSDWLMVSTQTISVARQRLRGPLNPQIESRAPRLRRDLRVDHEYLRARRKQFQALPRLVTKLQLPSQLLPSLLPPSLLPSSLLPSPQPAPTLQLSVDPRSGSAQMAGPLDCEEGDVYSKSSHLQSEKR